MDISIRTNLELVQDDQTWVGRGGVPRSACHDIVLDRSAFDLDAVFPDGYIPSGVVLALIDATGLYGPYAAAGIGGLAVARGFLFTAVTYDRDSTADLGAALFWDGEVIEGNLPTDNGLDAAAKVELLPGAAGGSLITFVAD